MKTIQNGELYYMSGRKGMLPTMFEISPVSKDHKIHQSELPISLCEQILEYVSYEGEVVGEAALNKKRNNKINRSQKLE